MMCGLCFCISLFSVRIKITSMICSIYLKGMENMNDETGTENRYCLFRFSLGLKNREIGY